METISTSFNTLNGEQVNVIFTKEQIQSGGKDILVCNHEDYELRLLRVDTNTETGKGTRIIYNAQITSKKSGIIIHAPVIQILNGEHAGTVMIGRTANFKKHRALLSKYISGDKIFDEVSVPYTDYMVMESILKTVCQDFS